ncbi:MAG: hypothetical protein K2Z80_22430 [Xanthobacteraceae bacterium]|jgi:hypothetical protein|nr:hypothetical protein [Xanthobacteraceae bacterium]
MILKIQSSVAETVDDTTPITIPLKAFPWVARILATIPIFVAVGPEGVTADDESFYVNEFDDVYLAIGAGEEISILGSDAGDEDAVAYVAHVTPSGP